MTAEIAVLNKSAVALAADSAVTIGRGARAKIYNTVNKIFELSRGQPVGVMVYGRLDFMGMPIETVVKQYREELGGRKFDHLAGYKEDFLSYIARNVPIRQEDEDANISVVMSGFFEDIADEIEARVMDDMRAHGKFRLGKVNFLANGVLNEEVDRLKAVPFVNGAKKAVVPPTLLPAVDGVAMRFLHKFSPSKETLACARKYAGHCIKRAVLSDYRTGIVFAGFGDKEWCPSLEAVELDGVIAGQLKKVDGRSIDITRGQIEADIVGFAQDDMVQSFLHGIDPRLRTYFIDSIGAAIKDTASRIISHLVANQTVASQTLNQLQPDFDSMREGFRQKADNYIEQVSTSQIRDMVRAMPKQELSNLASSLIEITSLKRKVSRAQESVGGEVDVAVISKSEGFVWTKRKHYFPKELNPRFFARHFNGQEQSIP